MKAASLAAAATAAARSPPRRRHRCSRPPSALAAAAAHAALPTAPASAAKEAKPTTRTTITRSAHVAFENCNAQHIMLTVTAPTHAFTPAQPVIVRVRLRNTGSTDVRRSAGRATSPRRTTP